jgi:hypothetical protein
MIPAFERAKTAHAFNSVATVISEGKTLQFYLLDKIT